MKVGGGSCRRIKKIKRLKFILVEGWGKGETR
jgi:hypothetical protein